jgi:hypothetical protein
VHPYIIKFNETQNRGRNNMRNIINIIIVGSIIVAGIYVFNTAKKSIESIQSSRVEMLNSIK